MWQRIVLAMLGRMVRHGRMHAVLPDGTRRSFGSGAGAPEVVVRLTDARWFRPLALDPERAMGEAYTAGDFRIEGGTLHDWFTLLARNAARANLGPVMGARIRASRALRRAAQRNGLARARRNVTHHYDLGDAFYRLWLDEDRQYSCAYWTRPDMTLEEAQEAKKAHVAAKLVLRPGLRVLDIGCGWGGLALTLARDHGVHVTGITLSENQAAAARARAEAAGLAHRIAIRLGDYRTLTERFDRVVSVGMLEHVGAPNYGAYFEAVRDRLGPDGVALVHTIGRCDPPSVTSTWLDRYIFPGGYNPALSELAAAFERTGLWQGDVEVWRGHYARTLRAWRERFERQRSRVAAMYDDDFVRMWRYYLVQAEVAFAENRHVVYQIQLARRRDAVPETRDYLHGPPVPQEAAAE